MLETPCPGIVTSRHQGRAAGPLGMPGGGRASGRAPGPAAAADRIAGLISAPPLIAPAV